MTFDEYVVLYREMCGIGRRISQIRLLENTGFHSRLMTLQYESLDFRRKEILQQMALSDPIMVPVSYLIEVDRMVENDTKQEILRQ